MKDWSGEDRLERDARARRMRAQNHLSRMRRGGGQLEIAPRARLPHRLVGVACLGAALFGACAGRVLVSAGRGGSLAAIEVRGAERLTPTEVARATGVPRGARVGDVDANAVAERLLDNAWIASARAVRLPTGRLLVQVEERRPKALLAIGAKRFAVDAEGSAFAELAPDEESALPKVVATPAPPPGVADALRVEAALLPERMQQLGLERPQEVRIAPPDDPEGVSLRLPGLTGVVVLGRESLDARLADLARLLEAQPDEAAKAARIDLRFADQAVLRSEATREGSQAAALRGGGAPRSRPTSG